LSFEVKCLFWSLDTIFGLLFLFFGFNANYLSFFWNLFARWMYCLSIKCRTTNSLKLYEPTTPLSLKSVFKKKDSTWRMHGGQQREKVVGRWFTSITKGGLGGNNQCFEDEAKKDLLALHSSLLTCSFANGVTNSFVWGAIVGARICI